MPIRRLTLALMAVCLTACGESADIGIATECSVPISTPDFVFAEPGSTIAVEVDTGEAMCAEPYRLSAMLVSSEGPVGTGPQHARLDAALVPDVTHILIPVDESTDAGVYFYSVWAHRAGSDTRTPPADSSRVGLVVFSSDMD